MFYRLPCFWDVSMLIPDRLPGRSQIHAFFDMNMGAAILFAPNFQVITMLITCLEGSCLKCANS